GIRDLAIDALDVWYQIPENSVIRIKDVVSMLHNASLMLDDIEDGSSLRRGYPATHLVYGVSQTINCANFLYVKCLDMVSKISQPAVRIFCEELHNLHLGQGYDLFWTYHAKPPSETEYLQMIDGKTGGLFRMASRLMRSEATINKYTSSFERLSKDYRSGGAPYSFWKIRDDYQNLASPTVSRF
ncbi:hypothetical protein N7467_005427, partial [Penicillium canescens]